MKKFYAAPLAAALAMSMTFSSLAAVKLETPTVRWNSEWEALPEWTRIENASNEYQVEAYRNGEEFYSIRHSYPANDTSEWLSGGGFVNNLEESGIYKFRIMALGDDIDTLDSEWSEMSSEWEFTKASISFGTPANLRWEGTVACWDAPEIPEEYEPYLLGYEVALYADGDQTVSHNAVGRDDNRFDNANWMKDENVKEYTFDVRAISRTPSKIFHGDWAKGENSYDQEGTSDNISGIVDGLLDKDSVKDAPDILKENLKELQTSMQTNEEVLKKIGELEKAYAAEKGIASETQIVSDSEDTGIDAADVKIVGALLNAAPGADEVTLNLKKPAREEVVDDMMYKNTVQIDFSLTNVVEILKVPVRLTVPIPENVNPDFFHVLHFDQNGNYEDIHPLDIDKENRTASFTVTHFSTFVLAEEGMDLGAVATPSNAKDFQKMADALPEDLASLSTEERADAEATLWKLADALSLSDVRSALAKKDAEATVAKLSALFDVLGGGAIDTATARPVENMEYYSLAFAPDFDTVTGLRAELSDVATPSNASRSYSFTLDLYASDGDGTETKVNTLRTPVKFYITMPDGFEDVTNESGEVWFDEETGCIVVYTNDPGRFTVKLRSETSGHSGGGSSSGGSTKSVRVDLMNQSPEGGKWVKAGDTWRYVFKSGILAQGCWLQLDWNGARNWYYFGQNGDMMTGWFRDNLNNWYYLTPAGKGSTGAMVTGWQQIDGTWYYFNEKNDGFCGTMLSNTTTPDGYAVDENGAWIQ